MERDSKKYEVLPGVPVPDIKTILNAASDFSSPGVEGVELKGEHVAFDPFKNQIQNNSKPSDADQNVSDADKAELQALGQKVAEEEDRISEESRKRMEAIKSQIIGPASMDDLSKRAASEMSEERRKEMEDKKKAQEEAEAIEEAKRQAREERRKQQQLALEESLARKAKENEERLAKEKAEREAREAEERKAKEAAMAEKMKAEADKKAQEEASKKAERDDEYKEWVKAKKEAALKEQAEKEAAAKAAAEKEASDKVAAEKAASLKASAEQAASEAQKTLKGDNKETSLETAVEEKDQGNVSFEVPSRDRKPSDAPKAIWDTAAALDENASLDDLLGDIKGPEILPSESVEKMPSIESTVFSDTLPPVEEISPAVAAFKPLETSSSPSSVNENSGENKPVEITEPKKVSDAASRLDDLASEFMSSKVKDDNDGESKAATDDDEYKETFDDFSEFL